MPLRRCDQNAPGAVSRPLPAGKEKSGSDAERQCRMGIGAILLWSDVFSIKQTARLNIINGNYPAKQTSSYKKILPGDLFNLAFLLHLV